jgi:multidrug efflux pump subunit AcrB
VVNHHGPFPSTTISYDLAPGNTLDAALADIDRAMAQMHAPAGLHGEAAGDARAFAEQASQQPLLILAALIAVISTLPSAGLGALLALRIAGMELSMTALISVILLIGIVKKNGIMLVDFALDGERRRGRGSTRHRRGPRLGNPPPARHHHHRRPRRLAIAEALHDAGDLPAARQAAPPARRRRRDGAGCRA